MTMKFGLPRLSQTLGSMTVFGVLLVGVASVDARVKDKFVDVISDNSVSSLGHSASGVAREVVSAARYHSIENAPLVVFATVGGVLFLFMVRT